MSDAARAKAGEMAMQFGFPGVQRYIDMFTKDLDAFAAEQTARAEAERDILRVTCDAHISVIDENNAEIAALREGVRRLDETCTCGAFMKVCRALLAGPVPPSGEPPHHREAKDRS